MPPTNRSFKLPPLRAIAAPRQFATDRRTEVAHHDVAVIIVSYNSEQQLGACLESVYRESRAVRMEVIVLDNHSTDGSAALVREKFPRVKLLTPGRNLGFAAGVNFAARSTSADFILLVNPDTVLLDRAIDVIVDFARRNPRHGFYGGRTFRPDMSLEPSSCWGLPTLWSLAMFAIGMSTFAKQNRWLDPESLGRWQRDSVREVGMITGCYLLVHRPAWEELGGFDERFFMYGEDADLAMRARAAGYRPVICPDAHLIHEIGRSSTPAEKLLLLYRGKATLLRTHWQGLRRNLGLGLLLTGVGVRAVAARISQMATKRSLDSNRWLVVWQQRATWSRGYPSAAPAAHA